VPTAQDSDRDRREICSQWRSVFTLRENDPNPHNHNSGPGGSFGAHGADKLVL